MVKNVYYFLTRINEMYVWETEEARQEFLKDYENEWDYWFINFDRGFTYGEFIRDNNDRFGYLLSEAMPKHISEINKEAIDEYLVYLKFYMMNYGNRDTWNIEEVDEKYGLDYALECYYYNYIL